MRLHPAALSLVLASAACSGATPIIIAEIPHVDGANTLLLRVDVRGTSVLRAFDLTNPVELDLDLEGDTTLTASYFPESLAELKVAPGVVTIVTADSADAIELNPTDTFDAKVVEGTHPEFTRHADPDPVYVGGAAEQPTLAISLLEWQSSHALIGVTASPPAPSPAET